MRGSSKLRDQMERILRSWGLNFSKIKLLEMAHKRYFWRRIKQMRKKENIKMHS